MALRIELNSPRSNHGVEPISSSDDTRGAVQQEGGGGRVERANFSPPHSVNAESEFKFHRRRSAGSVVDLKAEFAGTRDRCCGSFGCWIQDAGEDE